MKKTGFVILAIVILGIAYYGISPVFRHTRVNEAVPKTTPIAQDSTLPTSPSTTPPANTVGAEVIGTTGHPASGTARIVEANGVKYVRYENFKTLNGPDLFVYLAKDKNATEFINLGAIKATEGNVNYEIPANVNLKDYPYVLTWCRTFHVLFNSAQI